MVLQQTVYYRVLINAPEVLRFTGFSNDVFETKCGQIIYKLPAILGGIWQILFHIKSGRRRLLARGRLNKINTIFHLSKTIQDTSALDF